MLMNIVIRVDSSTIIGSGHVMRCLTLADTLREQGTKVIFICRQLPGNMCDFIEGKGYQVWCLPYNIKDFNGNIDENLLWLGATLQIDAEQTSQILHRISGKSTIDWLIVDHYSLDRQWEERMRSYVQKIMVIDDLANRYHDCDLLLDQNLYIDMLTRYDGLVSGQCQKLLGQQYVLLRPEFYDARATMKASNGIIKNIIVFLGGSDPTNETMKVLQAIKLLHREDIHVDVIVGNINPHKEQIIEVCDAMPNVTFHCQISNMAEMMCKADLAIGAGGATIWERSFLGLPAFTVVIADNQRKTTEAVAQMGAIINLGWHTEVSIANIYDKLVYVLQSHEILQEMSRQALALNSSISSMLVIEHICNKK